MHIKILSIFLIAWGIIGFVVFIQYTCKTMGTKASGWRTVFFAGPIIWVAIALIAIHEILNGGRFRLRQDS